MKSTAQTKAAPDEDGLGRLTTLGPKHAWQVALLLPNRFDDLSNPCTTLSQASREPGAFHLRVIGTPSSRFDGSGPRVAMQLMDAAGQTMRGMMFGAPRDITPLLVEGEQVVVLGSIREMGDSEILSITEIVPAADVGTLRPVYPGRPQVIGAPRVREVVRTHLRQAIPTAAAFLQDELTLMGRPSAILDALGCPGWTLEQVLAQAHRPRSIEYAEHAHAVLSRLAALIALARAERSRPPVGQHRTWSLPTLAARIQQLPFPLTPDQASGVARIAAGLCSSRPLRCILNGDVGTGKTPAFASIVAALHDAGARCAIMLPNEVLVEQVAGVVRAFFPDVPVLTVAAGAAADVRHAKVLVGTTALLHRDVGTIDLLVIDEQQKFGVKARQELLGVGTHLLECSATCIPRTLALARYGVVDVVELRSGPVKKDIITRIRSKDEGTALFREVADTLRNGDQVLVVYPLAEEGTSAAARHSVEAAGQRWEKMFPGRVRTLIGGDDSATKARVMGDLHAGRAQVLVATTVVEVGVDLARLRHVVVVHPDRFGLSTLHQIRGRVARKGGVGQCDLYCPAPLAEGSRERLSVLERTQDGFEVAERDLALRGFGDMSSGATAQSGGDESVLFGRPVMPDAVDAVSSVWAKFMGYERGERAGGG